MRCPDCGKFVPFDTEVEPETDSELEFDGQQLKGSFRRVLACAECGTELKEAGLDIDESLTVEGADDKCKGKDSNGEHEWEVESDGPQPTTDTVTKDRHGKPIKNPRYMKTLYGIEIVGAVTCIHCGITGEFDVSMSEQASAFEEMV